MTYRADFELRDQHLFATVGGPRTIESITSISREVVNECRRNGVSKVFIDLRQLTGRLEITDSLSVVERIFPAIESFRELEKVAVLEQKERFERSRFFERVAQSKGYNIRMFEDPDEATTWLTVTEQPAPETR